MSISIFEEFVLRFTTEYEEKLLLKITYNLYIVFFNHYFVLMIKVLTKYHYSMMVPKIYMNHFPYSLLLQASVEFKTRRCAMCMSSLYFCVFVTFCVLIK